MRYYNSQTKSVALLLADLKEEMAAFEIERNRITEHELESDVRRALGEIKLEVSRLTSHLADLKDLVAAHGAENLEYL